jgi:DNA primase
LSDRTIEEVQRASEIVEVVSSYLPLKRAGKDYKACCPFHREKTPSFYVSPAKQIFKCFGCGKGGSVFQFVMARENVTFPEAVRLLADRANIEIEEPQGRVEAHQGPDRSRVLKTVAWAVQVFERLLKDAEGGRAARAYLAERGFTDETVDCFRIGLAPDSWDALVSAAARRGVETDLLLAAGLVVARDSGSGVYDRFRNRVLFPIFDTLNRPIALGGRTLGDDPAKYLNSPDTAVFDKSRNLYGLPQARDAMQESRQVIVVEGYTDCIMAHQVGITNTVATLGTSLTRQHVRLLKRYVDDVVLVFDGDLAGQNAADRAMQLFLEEELDVHIVTLPGNLDPCDFLAEGHKDDFLAMIAQAPDALEHKWALVRLQFEEADSVRGKRQAVEAMLGALAAQPVWSQSSDRLKRDLLLSRMAAVLGIEQQSLRQRLGRLVRQARSTARYDDALDTSAPAPDPTEPVPRVDDLRSRAERLVLQVLLAAPDRIEGTCERLDPKDVRTGGHRRLYETLVTLKDRLASDGVSVLWSHLDDPATAELAANLAGSPEISQIEASGAPQEKLEAMLEDALATLTRLAERDELVSLRNRVAAAENEEDRRTALQRLQELRKNSQEFLPPGRAGKREQ